MAPSQTFAHSGIGAPIAMRKSINTNASAAAYAALPGVDFSGSGVPQFGHVAATGGSDIIRGITLELSGRCRNEM
jgi:hypothetical protein